MTTHIPPKIWEISTKPKTSHHKYSSGNDEMSTESTQERKLMTETDLQVDYTLPPKFGKFLRSLKQRVLNTVPVMTKRPQEAHKNGN